MTQVVRDMDGAGLPARPDVESIAYRKAILAAVLGIFYLITGAVDILVGGSTPSRTLSLNLDMMFLAGVAPLLYAGWRVMENRRLEARDRRRIALWRESVLRIMALRLGGRISVDEAAAHFDDPAEAGDFLAALEARGKLRLVVTEAGGVYYQFDADDRDAAEVV